MKSSLLAFCFATASFAADLPPCATEAVTNAAAMMEARTYVNAAGASLGYRVHAPAKVDPARRYPLVLFLHGSGERGSDNAMQLVHGVWQILSFMKKSGKEGYLLAPQCPAEQRWVDISWELQSHRMPARPSASMALTVELVETFIKEFPVDPRRVYVTGLSMGGYGTWDVIQRWPDLFAAAMPLCGGGDSHLAWKMRSLPIWVFHGDRDTAVPVVRSRQMVAALWQCDANVRYREYPDVGHNCWSMTYADHAVMEWFFSQTKK